jgi:hypothetical protein
VSVPDKTVLRENAFPAEFIMYPADAVTLYREISGPGAFTLLSGSSTKTILGVSIQQSATNSTSDIRCGASDIFVRNYGKDFPFNEINKICSADLVIEKTGQDAASFLITYVPRDLSQTQNATASVQFIEFGNNALLGIHGLTWLIYIGFGIALLLMGVRVGFMFLQK